MDDLARPGAVLPASEPGKFKYGIYVGPTAGAVLLESALLYPSKLDAQNAMNLAVDIINDEETARLHDYLANMS